MFLLGKIEESIDIKFGTFLARVGVCTARSRIAFYDIDIDFEIEIEGRFTL